MAFSTLIKILTFVATITLALSAGLPNAPRGFTRPIGNVPTFRGEINGQPYELNGTATQVLAQLKERYPSIELKTSATSQRTALQPRNKVLPPLCIPVRGQDWVAADRDDIMSCVFDLEVMGRIAIGGDACQPICCINGNSVWLCNDNPYTIDPAAPYLASYAYDIANDCYNVVGGTYMVGGQEFDTDNYNIIVRGKDYQTC